jgi:hypothetical protein
MVGCFVLTSLKGETQGKSMGMYFAGYSIALPGLSFFSSTTMTPTTRIWLLPGSIAALGG